VAKRKSGNSLKKSEEVSEIARRERVTAVVPLYQGEKFIEASLASLFAEPLIENVIVVDDGSQDRGPELVQDRFPDATLLTQENSGVSKARNMGLKTAESEFLLFLDQDDQLLPGAVENMLSTAKSENADFVYGDYYQVDLEGNDPLRVSQPDVTRAPEKQLLEINCSASVCCLFRRAAIVDVGGFDEAMMGCEDWDLYLRLALAKAKLRYIDAPVFKFRVHFSSTSKRYWLMWKCFKMFEAKHRSVTLTQENGREIEIRRRDRFLNDNLRYLYGPDDVNRPWIHRRYNRSVHFVQALLRDRSMAMDLARRSLFRPQP
jgi:teichuronic acid biosynthesis glycosyltransferase TuaG